MSYKIRYKVEYRNKKNDLITVNLYKKDYTGSVVKIEDLQNTVTLKYRPSEDAVIGSELSFSFVAKNKATFSDLLTSDYKDFKAEFLLNGVKKWSGYLVIDNITTSYFDYVYTFNLSFADALADLDKFIVTDNAGGEITGNNTLLWYIKNSIKHTELNLDFAVVLNTKEVNLMTLQTDNALAKATLPADRFKEMKSGNKEISDAKTVINEILKAFNCKLYQANNKIYIVNDLEVNSKIYYYSYADLSLQSTATNSNHYDLTNSKFERANELMMDRPLHVVKATYLNKNLPQNLIPNGDFSSDDTSFWTFQNGTRRILEGELELEAGHIMETGYVSGILTGSGISVSQKSTTDVIRVEFAYRMIEMWVNGVPSGREQTADYVSELNIKLMMGATVVAETNRMLAKNLTHFKHDFAIAGSGVYHLVISDRSTATNLYDRIIYRLDNMSFLPISVSGDNAETITTFDELYSGTNTGNKAIDIAESELMVGDGMQITDISNLRIGNALTGSWNTYNRTEGCRLQQLYVLNSLRLKQRYRSNIMLTVIANAFDVIDFNKHILIEGKRYVISDYTVNYSSIVNTYNLRLIELFTTDITYILATETLTSSDGQKSSSEQNISETDPTVPVHVKNITLSDITKWNNNTGTPTAVEWSTILNIPSTFAPATHSHAWSTITSKPSTFAPAAHTHTIAEISTLQTTLDSKAAITHVHSFSELQNVPEFAPLTHVHAFGEITGTLIASKGGTGISSYTVGNYLRALTATTLEQRTPAQVRVDIGAAATSHTHTIADISTLQTTLNSKAAIDHVHSFSELRNIPEFAELVHVHQIGEIVNLQTTLDAKAAANHTHTIANITNLQTTLDAKAAVDHVHSFSELVNIPEFAPLVHVHNLSETTGTLIASRGGTGITSYTAGNYLRALNATTLEQRTPTQLRGDIGAAATSHTHTIANITNLQTTLDAKAAITHVHSFSELQNVPEFAPLTHVHDFGEITGLVSVAKGGTGLNTIPLNSFLVGNGTGVMLPKTASEVITLIGAAATSHTHTIANITNLQTTLDAKAAITHVHSFSELQNVPEFAPLVHVHAFGEITGTLIASKGGTGITSYTAGNYLRALNATTLEQRTPSQLRGDIGAAATSHTHTIANITNLQTTLDAKAAITHVHSFSELQNVPEFAPLTHVHDIGEITGTVIASRGGTGITSYTAGNYLRALTATTLEQRTPAQVRVDIGAAATSHTHTIANITNLQTTLDAKAAITHVHSFSELQNVPEFAPLAHAHAFGEITGTCTVPKGGTGVVTVPVNNFLVGNGTGNMIPKTPAEVATLIGAVTSSHTHADMVTTNTAQTVTGTKTFSADVSVVKNNAWITIDSASTGTDAGEQGAGISIGESGYKGEAAVHLTYTGDGWSNLGMGIVSTTTNRPANNVLRMFYTSTTAYFQGDVIATGQVTAYSDSRLKTNIRDYEGGLQKVMMLRAKTYERIDLDNKEEVGFIAQEVQKIEPDLVKDGEHLSLDYSRISVMLVKAVQQQQQMIEELKTEIAALKGGAE